MHEEVGPQIVCGWKPRLIYERRATRLRGCDLEGNRAASVTNTKGTLMCFQFLSSDCRQIAPLYMFYVTLLKVRQYRLGSMAFRSVHVWKRFPFVDIPAIKALITIIFSTVLTVHLQNENRPQQFRPRSQGCCTWNSIKKRFQSIRWSM